MADFGHKRVKPLFRRFFKPLSAEGARSGGIGGSSSARGSGDRPWEGASAKKKAALRGEAGIRVQAFGKKKTATAVAFIRNGRGAIKINSQPIKLLQPEILRFKVYEPVLVVGEEHFRDINMRCRVSGGGHTSQVYAIRQAMAKALVAYYAKYKDAASALELKKQFSSYDRGLLISDPRRAESKKFGGRGARARRQKSYR